MTLNLNNINTCEDLAKAILSSRTILLVCHIAPDGDTLGSALALKDICKQFGSVIRLDIILYGEIPSIYQFLPNVETIKLPNATDLLDIYDLAIAIDVASADRLGGSDKLFNSARKTAVIDHHETNPLFANINLVADDASATGEIVYDLMETLDATLTKDIAIYLYTAILTDTGGFKFSNTSAKAFSVCSKLIATGIKPQEIYRLCYENRPIEMVKLHAHCVENVQLSQDKKIAWSILTRNTMNNFKAFDEHTDGIVELIRSINTVEIAILFKETKDGSLKVSFRSKNYDICSIAKEFNGGGHKLAAGCTIKNSSMGELINLILTKVKQLV
ncbi:MAG: bifunctional oligoribonuclease/PAP phosphatase NrnA [Cyanobacteriota bacterium]